MFVRGEQGAEGGPGGGGGGSRGVVVACDSLGLMGLPFYQLCC